MTFDEWLAQAEKNCTAYGEEFCIPCCLFEEASSHYHCSQCFGVTSGMMDFHESCTPHLFVRLIADLPRALALLRKYREAMKGALASKDQESADDILGKALEEHPDE